METDDNEHVYGTWIEKKILFETIENTCDRERKTNHKKRKKSLITAVSIQQVQCPLKILINFIASINIEDSAFSALSNSENIGKTKAKKLIWFEEATVINTLVNPKMIVLFS